MTEHLSRLPLPNGRVQRLPFFLASLLLLVAASIGTAMLLTTFDGTSGQPLAVALLALVWIAVLWTTYCLTVKRARDTGLPDWLCYLFPLAYVPATVASNANFEGLAFVLWLPPAAWITFAPSKDAAAPSPAATDPHRAPASATDESTDPAHFAAAMAEAEGGERDAGLWARAFAESEGDPVRTKARYVKERAQQLARER